MVDFLWLLLAYALGMLTGGLLLILAAFWSDIKHWINDLMWKIKLWRYK